MTQHKNKPHEHRNGERGNVFFYIFIGVALFGALSFAISQGNRGSVQTLQRDQDKLLASDIIEYGEAVARAAAQIRLRGATPSQVSFAHDDLSATYGTPGGSDSEFEIFHSDGGGVIVKTLDSNAGVTTPTILFTGANEFSGIGTTTGTSSASDLIMLIRNLRMDVCKWINALQGIQDIDHPVPEENQVDFTLFDGTYGAAQTLGDDDTGNASPIPDDRLLSKSAGCFRDDNSGEYIYYRVLVAR